MDTLNPALVAALAGLGGTIIGALSAGLCTWLTQRGALQRAKLAATAENERHLRASIVHIAERFHDFMDEETTRINEQLDGDHKVAHMTVADYLLLALALEKLIKEVKVVDKSSLKILAKEFDDAVAILNEYRREASEKALRQMFAQY